MMPQGFQSFLFGAGVAMSIGPIALLIANVAARRGIGAGVCSALGAAVADFVYALIAFLAGHSIAATIAEHSTAFNVAAGLALCCVGGTMLLNGLKRSDEVTEIRRADMSLRPFSSTFLLTLVNPMGIVIFAGFALTLPAVATAAEAALYAVCVFAGSLIVQILFAAAGSALGRALHRPGLLRRLSAASGLTIICFGSLPLIKFLAFD